MAHRLLQIPLGISLRETASFDAFIARDNSQALTDIKNCAAGTGEQFLYLWGAPGVGKSHLLQATCRAAQRGANRVAYVPLSQVDEFSPEILSGLGALDLVCLDDIQRAGGDAEWERGLFTLFNQLRDRGAPLIVAADAPPTRLPVRLADLRSRLEWGLCYQLHPLDDAGRVQLLTESAQRRGLSLAEGTARYLLCHSTRDSASLLALLDRLDRASLAAQHKLTIPFVKTILIQEGD